MTSSAHLPGQHEARAALQRIRGNAAVLHDRVRGEVSRQVALQIMSDVDIGLAALHNLTAASAEVHEGSYGQDVAPAMPKETDIASMIRMLLEIISNIDHGSDDVSAHAHRAAIETVQNLAIALGVADKVQRHPSTTGELTTEPSRPAMPAQPADDRDEEEWIDLADSLSCKGAPLADEDLLSAVQAAVALQEMRDDVVISLECIHRRVGHCHLLFDQILREGQRSRSDFLIGQFADIGRDLATEVQDECLSLRRMLKGAGKEVSHD